MDAPLKELARLEKLANAKGKGPSIPSTLDSLLQTLQQAKEALQTGELSPEQFIALTQTIEAKKKEIDERQKEVYSATSRFGKALDKVCRPLSLLRVNLLIIS
jgi:hypothetical protein